MNILAPLKGRSPVGVDERLFLIDTLDSCVIGSSKHFKAEQIVIEKEITQDEIIQYYSSQELMDQDDIFYLKDIQSNRNGIHSFEERTIGTWNDLQYCVRFWCYLLEWIMNRLPDIPDYN